MNSQTEILVGLDIGSSNIRVAIGELSPDSDRVNIIGLAEGKSAGVSRGNVRSIEEVVEAISQVISKAEKMTGLSLSHATIAISGSHITSQDSKGVIAVARADGEIQEDDVERVLEAAQAVSVPPNYEILHVIPKNYSIDNQTGIKDPIGMNGVRLEVEAQIIEGQSAHIKNVTKAISLSSLEIDDLVLASLASSESSLTERQKDLGVALVNIGGATTSILVFEEGDILKVSVLPIGSGHITNDIAIGLRTNVDIAEEIKLSYGYASSEKIGKKDLVDLRTISEDEEGTFSVSQVAEIIEARVEELFSLVDKELKSVNRSGKLPAGIVLTGSGSKLNGIVDVAKKVFRLPSSIGVPTGVDSAIDRINDPGATTSVGLVMWAQASQISSVSSFGGWGKKGIGNIFDSLKSFMKIFKP